MVKNDTHPYDLKIRKKVAKDFKIGKTQKEILEGTGVSLSSQQRFIRKMRENQPLGVKKKTKRC